MLFPNVSEATLFGNLKNSDLHDLIFEWAPSWAANGQILTPRCLCVFPSDLSTLYCRIVLLELYFRADMAVYNFAGKTVINSVADGSVEFRIQESAIRQVESYIYGHDISSH